MAMSIEQKIGQMYKALEEMQITEATEQLTEHGTVNIESAL
jgi:hypothetical protein